MLFQRLNLDPGSGFNYEYMGYAEFEFGVTMEARTALAQAWMNNTLASFRTMLVSRGESVAVLVIHTPSPKPLEGLSPTWNALSEKSGLRVTNTDVVGWMTVRSDPTFFVLRDDAHLSSRLAALEKFLHPAVEHLEAKAQHKETVV